MSIVTGLTVPGSAGDAVEQALAELVSNRVASRIAAQDATLWGPEAEHEAGIRLGWVDIATHATEVIAQTYAVRDRLRDEGVHRIVLCGMGGSSLAPEVICATKGAALEVLDSSNPDRVRPAVAELLHETAVVVSSKSGSTVETDSQRRIFEHAFIQAGIDPTTRIVVVTDPGSPLDQEARAGGYTVVNADPNVGGRYSALTAFGLVPSGLAGVDLEALVAEAEAARALLESDSETNPGLRLGALLGVAATQGVDKVVIAPHQTTLFGFGDWAEQLIAESTGKDGHGILPVVVSSIASANFSPSTADSVLVTLGDPDHRVVPASGWAGHVDAPLGAQFLLWEYATAIASRIIGINPFDQPDVESAKAAARTLLGGHAGHPEPAFVDGDLTVFASPGLLSDEVTTASAALGAFFAALDTEHGYVSLQAYLDSERDNELVALRKRLATWTSRPVTFGWGPRFLHSTGQYHKGGPATGIYLQVTTEPTADLDIPGRDFTLQEFIVSQSVGDSTVLVQHGRPVLRIHLANPKALGGLIDLFATL